MELPNQLRTIVKNSSPDKLGVSKRTVATLCGSWREHEEDGGLIFVFKNRNSCVSPDPVKESDLPENIVDVWEENQNSKTKENSEDFEQLAINSNNSGEKRKNEDDGADQKFKKAKLVPKGSKAKRPGFSEDRYNETSYYFENGLRKVYPYYFTFTTFAKGRWVGDSVLDVFSREFRAAPAEVYESCIREGRLTVNSEKVDPEYKLKQNDLLANVVHRHEVPVTDQPITFVHIDEDLVVINKPASIPVHPCGRYRHNTVTFILAKEYNLKNLRTIHRLDRLTSGLLLFGRTARKAQQLEQQIRSRELEKVYLCRVVGDFPKEEIVCNEPIEVVSYKIGVCMVSDKGKDCRTRFTRLGYNSDSNSSVVLCRPRTGRMHQIRVHLQYLGYPIVNDPLYNHKLFGPVCGKSGDFGGKTREQLVKELIQAHNAENWLGEDGGDVVFANPDNSDLQKVNPETANGNTHPPEPARSTNLGPDLAMSPTSDTNESPQIDKVSVATQTGQMSNAPPPAGAAYDPACFECQVRYRDPRPKDLVMYLHAWKYKGADWAFETEQPQWADVDWKEAEDL